MFANCQKGGTSTATAPDVCKTPAPPAPPVPTPYPNIAQGNMGTPPVKHVLIECMPAHNMGTKIPMSNGDNPGVLGGMVSNRNMGPSRFITCSTKVLYGNKPATRLTDKTLQNQNNAPGARVVPSQTTVLILS